MTGNVGVYAEYTGYFDGEYGVLSGTNKMQDNLYYQDFSYVVKTGQDVETYRDKILELVHPAGMALFGEILMTANLSVTLFDNATRNINTTQANTAQVANSENVSLYNVHEVEFYTSNTATTNNQVLTESSYSYSWYLTALGGQFDAKMDTTGGSTDFDLQLEHGNDLFSLESSGYFLAFENNGELLLEIDIGGNVGDRLIEETADFLLTEDNIVRTSLEDATNDNGDILLLEDGTTTNDNITHEGVLLNEEHDGSSSPIIYEFFEAQLGNILTEDGDGIGVDVLSSDTLQIEEYNGDFIVMDGIRNLIHIRLEGDTTAAIILDEVTLTGGPIAFETGGTAGVHGGTVLLNSTDGAPGTDAGDQLVSEVMSSNEISSLLNEESDEDTTLDGAYFVQEDVGAGSTIGPPRARTAAEAAEVLTHGEFSQGFKIQQEGTFTEVVTEGNLSQEDGSFTLLEAQSTAGDLSADIRIYNT